MEAKLYLFCVKKNEENAVYSHLSLGESVSQVISKFNEDLTYLKTSAPAEDIDEINDIMNYFKNCSLWCLGSIDFVSGELIPHLEQHNNLIDVLEVLKSEI